MNRRHREGDRWSRAGLHLGVRRLLTSATTIEVEHRTRIRLRYENGRESYENGRESDWLDAEATGYQREDALSTPTMELHAQLVRLGLDALERVLGSREPSVVSPSELAWFRRAFERHMRERMAQIAGAIVMENELDVEQAADLAAGFALRVAADACGGDTGQKLKTLAEDAEVRREAVRLAMGRSS